MRITLNLQDGLKELASCPYNDVDVKVLWCSYWGPAYSTDFYIVVNKGVPVVYAHTPQRHLIERPASLYKEELKDLRTAWCWAFTGTQVLPGVVYTVMQHDGVFG